MKNSIRLKKFSTQGSGERGSMRVIRYTLYQFRSIYTKHLSNFIQSFSGDDGGREAVNSLDGLNINISSSRKSPLTDPRLLGDFLHFEPYHALYPSPCGRRSVAGY